MKNKIVTLLCIMTILITTAVVALGGNRQPYDIDTASADGVDVVQHLQKYGTDSTLVDVEDSDVIYPAAGEYNASDRITTVTNNTVVETGAPDVYVRTIFAFEAADLTIAEFHDVMYLMLNQDMSGENRTVCWDYPADTDWISMTCDGQNYYMLVATYCRPLANATTAPSLLKVGFESTAEGEVLESFGATYEMMVKTQAVEASGFTSGETPSEALDAAFGAITSTNHPWMAGSN